jgi:acetylornithine deacetylase/succinyl-diaminopimelate desuccinylase-like protein
MDKQQLASTFEASKDEMIRGWVEFLQYKSISTNLEWRSECEACAAWCQSRLQELGFSVALLETPGNPLVFGVRQGDPALPTILIYGHYDVQPPEPLELWLSAPFSPEIRDGRMFARGAEDNKGQLWYVLSAVKALIGAGALKNTVKFLIEGEEECGSPGLHETLDRYGSKFTADVLLVCDTGTTSLDRGSVCMGLRGMVELEAQITGPGRDVHSGVFGGILKNPAVEMAKLIAGCFADDGSVAVPGFYEGVVEPSESLVALAGDGFDLDPDELGQAVGAPLSGGERRYPLGVRRGLRPTLEVNGMFSGYTGPGGKTIIPSTATVKLSARLVRGQDPARVMSALKADLASRAPKDLKFAISRSHVGGSALSLDPDGRFVKRARETLRALHEAEPRLLWEGGSIPVIPQVIEASGNPEAILVGYGLERDAIHAPNENFGIDQFRLGYLFVGMFLQALSV